MDININISSSSDVAFESALLFAPISNYSDGQDRGFRPAIRQALVRLPKTILRSGMFNIKDHDSEDTADKAIAVASSCLITGECICTEMVDQMLETYEREA